MRIAAGMFLLLTFITTISLLWAIFVMRNSSSAIVRAKSAISRNNTDLTRTAFEQGDPHVKSMDGWHDGNAMTEASLSASSGFMKLQYVASLQQTTATMISATASTMQPADKSNNSTVVTTSLVSYCRNNLDRRGLGNRLFSLVALLNVAWTSDRLPVIPTGGGFEENLDHKKAAFQKCSYRWFLDEIFEGLRDSEGSCSNNNRANETEMEPQQIYRIGYDIICRNGCQWYHEKAGMTYDGDEILEVAINRTIRNQSLLMCGYYQSWKYFNGDYVSRDAMDLAILSHCNNGTILSVGTYGWWAAWLANAPMVVYYPGWPKPGSPLYNIYTRDDFVPPHWIPRY